MRQHKIFHNDITLKYRASEEHDHELSTASWAWHLAGMGKITNTYMSASVGTNQQNLKVNNRA
jgi:hypothetical protein